MTGLARSQIVNHPSTTCRAAGRVVGLAHRVVGGEIVAGGKRGAGPAQDRDADGGIRVGRLQGVEDRAAQLIAEGVALLRAVQGEPADAGQGIVEQ